MAELGVEVLDPVPGAVQGHGDPAAGGRQDRPRQTGAAASPPVKTGPGTTQGKK
jgi:hypothetical protein